MPMKARGTAALKPSPVRLAESDGHAPLSLSPPPPLLCCLFFLSFCLSLVLSLSLPISLAPNLSRCLSFSYLFTPLVWQHLCLSAAVLSFSVCRVFAQFSCLSWCLLISVSVIISALPALLFWHSISPPPSESLFDSVSSVTPQSLSFCPRPVAFSLSVSLCVFLPSCVIYIFFMFCCSLAH